MCWRLGPLLVALSHAERHAGHRALHQIPELGFREQKTSAFVRKKLSKLGIAFKYPVATTGITADLGSGKPIFAIRSDMDALPILVRSRQVNTCDSLFLCLKSYIKHIASQRGTLLSRHLLKPLLMLQA